MKLPPSHQTQANTVNTVSDHDTLTIEDFDHEEISEAERLQDVLPVAAQQKTLDHLLRNDFVIVKFEVTEKNKLILRWTDNK